MFPYVVPVTVFVVFVALILNFLLSSVTFMRYIFGSYVLDKDLIPSQNAVVITGCDSGFGLQLSLLLTELKFFVIATVLTEEGEKRLKDKIGLVVRGDISNPQHAEDVLVKTRQSLKDKNIKLWALVNNAGIGDGNLTDFTALSVFEKVMSINFFGVVRFTKVFLPLLKESRESRVINLSSLAGHFGLSGMGPYCASKHALEGFAKSIRSELQYFGIHVVNINPSFMKTNIISAAGEASKKIYENAPNDILSQYDMEKLNSSKDTLHYVTEDPIKVVNEIVSVITDKYPLFYHPVGYGGIFLRGFESLPLFFLESLLKLASPSGSIKSKK